MTDTRKITVLIDSDNTPHAMLSLIMDELSTYGQIIVKRAYPALFMKLAHKQRRRAVYPL